MRFEKTVDVSQEHRIVGAGLLEVRISVAGGPAKGAVEKLPHSLPMFDIGDTRRLR
ncbi:MAG: hypothetical protein ABW318_25915 [Vicinamibacterales bacterium]